MTTQQIVSRYNKSKVLFECDLPENIKTRFAIRYALEKAVKAKCDLSGADLSGADLSGADLRDTGLRYANLRYANLRDTDLRGSGSSNDKQAIANLDKVREIIMDYDARLDMGHWHSYESEWKSNSCAEEVLCGTTHCLAGWLQVCSTDPKVRKLDPQMAGILIAPVAAKMFFRDRDEVLCWLKDRKYVAEIEEGNRRAEERKAKRAQEAV